MFPKKLAVISLLSFGFLFVTINSAQATYFGHSSWRDAEKTYASSEDDLMCWAAAASNILDWGGWGTSNFNTEDKIFQSFQDHWTDEGGMMNFGWDWWLNGTNPPDWPEWSQVDVSGGGNHWPEREFSNYYHENWNAKESMSAIDDYLHAGYGVTLAIYKDPDLGHALTVWGYEYGDSGYEGIYVTDSDDYISQLAYYPVSQINDEWYLGESLTGYAIGGVEGLAVTPEPISCLLFLVGAGPLVFASRKRKRLANCNS